ncbi:UNVERIFIED_ORG: Mn-containing catalase [Rhizobium esperanzae]|nr:putative catalase protein [Rhizobium etli CNPAF512]
MYHHVKKLMYTVRVDEPDPKFGNMLLEQFGGANGELAAAMQYSIQGLNCEDPGRKDLLMDIGTEELSHLEIVGTLARMHLKPLKSVREEAEADPLIAIAGGGGVNLFNSMGNPWTADYLKITGELDVDLRSNIAAEARAKIVYERLIDFCRDPGTKDALQFLMTREITHMRAFALALESMGKPPLSVGRIAPTAGLVDQFFNDSTGQGDLGEVDSRGPWNEGEPWEFVEAPAFQHLPGAENGGRAIRAQSAPPEGAEAIQEVLVDELRDLLHAEKQLLKALPKMQKAARTQQLQSLLRNHLAETEAQVERLNECLRILGTSARAKPCKGMAGLVEEGEEVMAEGKKKEDAPADLALIGAALRVEHYEIAAYTTARNMALQLGQPAVAQLLTLSLGEEQNAGQLLDQVAQPLMSAARMPSCVLVTV